jgi:hypothetical protein
MRQLMCTAVRQLRSDQQLIIPPLHTSLCAFALPCMSIFLTPLLPEGETMAIQENSTYQIMHPDGAGG